MIIDTSVLVAILKEEPGYEQLIDLLLSEPTQNKISAGTLLEAMIVIDGNRDAVISRRLDELVTQTDLRVIPFDEFQVLTARGAYRDFGKGSGHRAQLNFGDCFAYALAYETREPLLCKGDDFRHTGIELA